MSKIMVFVKGMGDGAGDWCDIDEENLDLTEHDTIIREDVIEEVKSLYKRQLCCGYTDCVSCDLFCNGRNFMDALERLKEEKINV